MAKFTKLSAGPFVTVKPLSITENNTYTAPEGEAYSPITVNVAGGGEGGGIIDVETLPTENIDENAVYRTAEEVIKGPEVYVKIQGGDYFTVAEYFAAQGVTATISTTQVSELPAVMQPYDQATFTMPLYVLESDGKAYLSTDGTSASAMTFGAMMGDADLDKGWTDDIAAESNEETGIYCARGGTYSIYSYWHYSNSVWAALESVADVAELPAENIDPEVCYHVIDEDKYFVYENYDWTEWAKGPDTYEFISGEGTGHLKLSTGMTKIAPYACYGRKYDKVTLPASLTSIGEKAFQNCPNLRTFYYTGIITNEIPIENPVAWADPYSVIIQPADKTVVYGREGVQYRDGTSSGKYVANDESTLVTEQDIYIASTVDGAPVSSVYTSGFRYNNYIERVYMEDGIVDISAWAFANCTELVSITIPSSVTKIDNDVFNNSLNLVDIHYLGTMEQWNAIEKGSSTLAWDRSTGNYTIHCTDGDIAKS